MNTLKGFYPATAMPDRDWWTILWPDPKNTLRSLGIGPGMVVVDLCCGDGYFTAALARIVCGKVYGVDIDPDMLDLTRVELDRAGGTVLGLIHTDARNLPELLEEKADYVLIANTFHGVQEKTELAHAVGNILNSGGRFAIINWRQLPRECTVVLGLPRGPKTEMRMSPDELQRAVEPAGFVLEQVVELRPYHYGAIFRVRSQETDERQSAT